MQLTRLNISFLSCRTVQLQPRLSFGSAAVNQLVSRGVSVGSRWLPSGGDHVGPFHQLRLK